MFGMKDIMIIIQINSYNYFYKIIKNLLLF